VEASNDYDKRENISMVEIIYKTSRSIKNPSPQAQTTYKILLIG
jgi:hypothetical protein